MSNSTVNALKSVVVITPAVRIWSGRVTVRRHEDLTTASGLPPEAIVSDGAKRIIDPKHLTVLESQRRGVDRYLAKVGIRSPMGFLIKPEDEGEVYAELQRREVLFNEAKAELVSNYDRLCGQWEAKNAGHEQLLRRNRPTALQVAEAIEFDYAPFKLSESDSDEGKARFESVGKAATSALINDVTTSAANLFRDSFKGKQSVTQRAVNVVRDMIEKLRAFSMFDPRVGPAADALEKVLTDVPQKGPLGPMDTMIVGGLLRSMSDPDALLSAGADQGGVDDEQAENETSTQDAIQQAEAKDMEDEDSAAAPAAIAPKPAPATENRHVAAVF